uniref:TBPIP domain-containing protein n=1 Tax=Syphacia muris TaxID=451379 RepID=A0A158R665_9BILA
MEPTNSLEIVVRHAVKKLASLVTDEELKKIMRKVGIKLNNSTVLEIAKTGKARFIQQCNSEVDSLVHDDEILEKIEKLKDLIKAATDNGASSKGWRPTGEPEIDAFGHVRKEMLAYEKRLADFKALLAKEVEEKMATLEKMRNELTKNAFIKNLDTTSPEILSDF